MRIGIVDDRALAVEAVRRVLARVPNYQVAWVARDGEEAVRRTAADRPDLILMDLVMPGVNGAEATRRIMAATPCPILIVTATVSGNFGLVYEALGAGAVDAVNTPTLGPDGATAGGDGLLAKIAQVAKKMRSAAGLSSMSIPVLRPAPPVVAVGASTGGPQAVAELVGQLPAGFPGAVLLVQHITADFTAGLADWLASKVRLPVRVAQPGEAPAVGTVLVAGRDDHLVVTPDGKLSYTAHPADTPFRPNVDALFGSLAEHWPQPGSAALLTGMGRDGAAGLLRLRRAGWTTYAQDKGSCVVYGMPEAAARLAAAAHVLTPAEIGRAIAAAVRK
jgi:two-component system response regulator WspF